MKKIFVFLLMLICILELSSCEAPSYIENQFYSSETLEEGLVPNLPKPNGEYYSNNSNFIYFNLSSEEVREYAKTVYAYLASQNYKYLGTRGEQKSSLAGAFASYYFRDVDSFGECYTQFYSMEYIFVYSNDDDDSDGILFNEIIISPINSKTIKHEGKEITCNAKIELNYDESYYLKEEIIDYPTEEMILYTWFFHSCIVNGKEIVLYDKIENENRIVTTEYSLIEFNNDYSGEFKFEDKISEFIWSVIDSYNVKVEFNDDSSGIVTFKDDDIIVFKYNNMMFVYEDRL